MARGFPILFGHSFSFSKVLILEIVLIFAKTCLDTSPFSFYEAILSPSSKAFLVITMLNDNSPSWLFTDPYAYQYSDLSNYASNAQGNRSVPTADANIPVTTPQNPVSVVSRATDLRESGISSKRRRSSSRSMHCPSPSRTMEITGAGHAQRPVPSSCEELVVGP